MAYELRNKEMPHKPRDEVPQLQRRFQRMARVMYNTRPSPLVFGNMEQFYIALDAWRDVIVGICEHFYSTDEEFNSEVFKRASNW